MFIGRIDLLKSLTKQSNLFLPFGKVRMGYHTGRDRYSWFIVSNKWTSRILFNPKRSLGRLLYFIFTACSLLFFIRRLLLVFNS